MVQSSDALGDIWVGVGLQGTNTDDSWVKFGVQGTNTDDSWVKVGLQGTNTDDSWVIVGLEGTNTDDSCIGVGSEGALKELTVTGRLGAGTDEAGMEGVACRVDRLLFTNCWP